jgi:hypothetical protein
VQLVGSDRPALHDAAQHLGDGDREEGGIAATCIATGFSLSSAVGFVTLTSFTCFYCRLGQSQAARFQ